MNDDFPWETFAKWAVGALMGLLHSIGLYQVVRIGKLENDKADKADATKRLGFLEAGKADKLEVRDIMTEWRAEREAASERWHADRAATELSRETLRQEIKAVALSVATIEGHLDRMPKRSTD